MHGSAASAVDLLRAAREDQQQLAVGIHSELADEHADLAVRLPIHANDCVPSAASAGHSAALSCRRPLPLTAHVASPGRYAQDPVLLSERQVLARWRVTDSVQRGGLNVRAAPSKTAAVLLRLPKLAVLEACGR